MTSSIFNFSPLAKGISRVRLKWVALSLLCALALVPIYYAQDIKISSIFLFEVLGLGCAVTLGKEKLRFYLSFLLLTLLFLSTGELYMRLHDLGPSAISINVRPARPYDFFSPLDFDFETATMFKAGRYDYATKSYTVNNRGFRDRNHAIAKTTDAFRIVVLGSSITAGFSLNDNEGFIPQTERILNETGSNIEIINLASPGASFHNMIHYLKTEGLPFKPDLVLIEMVPFSPAGFGDEVGKVQRAGPSNDVIREYMYRPIGDRLLGAYAGSFSFFINYISEWERGLRRRTAKEIKLPEDVLKELRAVDNKVPMALVLMPGVFTERSILGAQQMLPKLEAANADPTNILSKFFLFNLTPAIEGLQPRDLRVRLDDGHPNAKASRLFAARLAELLRPKIEKFKN